MPAKTKTTIDLQPAIALPEQHVAILFEGAWMFAPDRDDSTRVLAICPYVDAPDHVCVYGVWPYPPGAKGNPTLTAEMLEENRYRVDMQPSRNTAMSYREVFEAAAAKYGIIYVRSAGAQEEISVSTPAKARRISVPIPDEIRAAGKLRGATISLGSAADKYELGIDGKPVSLFVTLIFIYKYAGEKPQFSVACTTVPGLPALDPPPPGPETHLVIRVHAVQKPLIGSVQAMDSVQAEDEHFTETFNLLRGLIRIRPLGSAQMPPVHPDFRLAPPTHAMVFEKGDTTLTLEELGLPDGAIPEPTYGNLAACAGGVEAIGER